MVLVGEQHSDIPGEALQEQEGKEDVGVLVRWAQLPHVGKEAPTVSCRPAAPTRAGAPPSVSRSADDWKAEPLTVCCNAPRDLAW